MVIPTTGRPFLRYGSIGLVFVVGHPYKKVLKVLTYPFLRMYHESNPYLFGRTPTLWVSIHIVVTRTTRHIPFHHVV